MSSTPRRRRSSSSHSTWSGCAALPSVKTCGCSSSSNVSSSRPSRIRDTISAWRSQASRYPTLPSQQALTRCNGNLFVGVIRGSDQRACFDVRESHLDSAFLESKELLWSVVAHYLGVLLAGPQVLAHGEDV